MIIISQSKEEHLICAGLVFTDHCTVKWRRDHIHEMQLSLQPLNSVPRKDKYPFIPAQGSVTDTAMLHFGILNFRAGYG